MSRSAAHRAFVENCEDILARQSDVHINEAAIEAYAKTLKASDFVPDWKDYISAAANSAEGYDFKRAFYEMAMIVSNQGGFIFEDEHGDARKWHLNGSGAKAMIAKMAELRDAGALPYYDLKPQDVRAKVMPLLADVPFAEKRLEIFEAFADPVRHQAVMDLIDAAKKGDEYVFDVSFAQNLAAIMPEGFGEDPFLKKSILTALMAAGNGYHHGVKVDVSDMTVAADYILPQVLNADHIGVLSFSPTLTEKLQKRQLFAENAQEVTVLRAAAVVACEKLASLSGLSAQDIDGHLWMAGRKLENARPHMMCVTMQF